MFFTLFVFFNKLEQFISQLVADISKTDLRRRARLWKRLLQEKQEKLRLSGSTHTCLASARWSLHTCLLETRNIICWQNCINKNISLCLFNFNLQINHQKFLHGFYTKIMSKSCLYSEGFDYFVTSNRVKYPKI